MLLTPILPSTPPALDQEFKGYVFKIMGGQDKQGFPMKQGVLTSGRVQVLMSPGDQCFRGYGRRNGERRRKSVRGCIVSPDLSVLNLVIVKKGEPPAWEVDCMGVGVWPGGMCGWCCTLLAVRGVAQLCGKTVSKMNGG